MKRAGHLRGILEIRRLKPNQEEYACSRPWKIRFPQGQRGVMTFGVDE